MNEKSITVVAGATVIVASLIARHIAKKQEIKHAAALAAVNTKDFHSAFEMGWESGVEYARTQARFNSIVADL